MSYPRDLSIADVIKQYGLPKSHRVYWSKSKKADVVQAVHDRVISFHEARERYLLSRSEFEQWEREAGIAPAAERDHSERNLEVA